MNRTPRFLLLPMRMLLATFAGAALHASVPLPVATASPAPSLLVVVGAPGEPEFESLFIDWAAAWTRAAATGGAAFTVIGTNSPSSESTPDNPPATDAELLRAWLEAQTKECELPLWVVLIGHGTFDGRDAKFNLRGPDVSAAQLGEWLQPFQRPLALINCSSASAPFINALSGTNRVVITATRSGAEQNFSRFGRFLAGAIGNPDADLDKDDQTSLLEAFLIASRQVEEWYAAEGRLATEHALLDDNGDGRGTSADWFRGVRPVRQAEAGAAPDGYRAHQFHLIPSLAEQQMPPEIRARRDALELDFIRLRDAKESYGEDEYYSKLEAVLLDLARLYHSSGSEE